MPGRQASEPKEYGFCTPQPDMCPKDSIEYGLCAKAVLNRVRSQRDHQEVNSAGHPAQQGP